MQTWWKKNLTSPVINYLGKKREYRLFSKSPILIGGCARSGTSLMLSILSAHPKIFCFPHEVDAFTSWDVDSRPERLDRLYRYLITHRVPRTAERWCEKRPFNVRYLPELLSHFDDEFRFINMVRDPRSVCTSVHPEDPDRYWVEPDRWINDVEKGLVFQDHQQVMTVRFEDLVTNSQQKIEEICRFLEESFSEEMSDWFTHATVKSNRAWFSELMPIHEISIDHWNNPKHSDRIALLQENESLIRLAGKLGYDLLD